MPENQTPNKPFTEGASDTQSAGPTQRESEQPGSPAANAAAQEAARPEGDDERIAEAKANLEARAAVNSDELAQRHPDVPGEPAEVTQEGRSIRDAQAHEHALETLLSRPDAGLSDIQRQKLKGREHLESLIDKSKADPDELRAAMREATTDAEREAIVRKARAHLQLQNSVALLREPEDPNADPVRDLPVA